MWKTIFIIHAIREIAQDKKITISYFFIDSSNFRRRHLQKHFDFDCIYNLCNLLAIKLVLSNNKLMKIQYLDNIIGDDEHLMLHSQ